MMILRLAPCCWMVVLTLAWAAPSEGADGTGSAAPTSQEVGRALLMDMADYLAGLDRFGVTIRGGYDVVQDDGQKIEFLEVRKVTIARPNMLRIEETRADGRDSLVLFDGTLMTVWDAVEQVFAQADQPGTVDDAIVYYTRDLGLRMPLAPVFLSTLPIELERRLISVDYVEPTLGPLFAEPAHQVVARTAAADVQVWIADTEQPWPLRIVVTYPHEPGQPQYWAEFTDWTLRPKVSKARFEFDPPADARRIVFAVQVTPPSEALPVAGETVPGSGQSTGEMP